MSAWTDGAITSSVCDGPFSWAVSRQGAHWSACRAPVADTAWKTRSLCDTWKSTLTTSRLHGRELIPFRPYSSLLLLLLILLFDTDVLIDRTVTGEWLPCVYRSPIISRRSSNRLASGQVARTKNTYMYTRTEVLAPTDTFRHFVNK